MESMKTFFIVRPSNIIPFFVVLPANSTAAGWVIVNIVFTICMIGWLQAQGFSDGVETAWIKNHVMSAGLYAVTIDINILFHSKNPWRLLVQIIRVIAIGIGYRKLTATVEENNCITFFMLRVANAFLLALR